jgi:hypothetical protein
MLIIIHGLEKVDTPILSQEPKSMLQVRGVVFAIALVATALLASTATAQEVDLSFNDWSDVTQVCPTCEPPPADELVLRNGDTVQGTIRAVNPVFYTVERFGEVRTVPSGDVQEVNWKRGDQPSGLDSLDQIVLQNGHVLTGEIIVDNDRPPYFEIQSSYLEYSYTVFKSQIAMVFRDGEQYDFEAAMREVEDARE